MGRKVKVSHVGDIIMVWSSLLFGFNAGRKTCIPTNAYLILGRGKPILVDTGVRDVSLFRSIERGWSAPELVPLKEHGGLILNDKVLKILLI